MRADFGSQRQEGDQRHLSALLVGAVNLVLAVAGLLAGTLVAGLSVAAG